MPFTDGTFDAVLATVMLHHLGRKARQQCACPQNAPIRPAAVHLG